MNIFVCFSWDSIKQKHRVIFLISWDPIKKHRVIFLISWDPIKKNKGIFFDFMRFSSYKFNTSLLLFGLASSFEWDLLSFLFLFFPSSGALLLPPEASLLGPLSPCGPSAKERQMSSQWSSLASRTLLNASRRCSGAMSLKLWQLWPRWTSSPRRRQIKQIWQGQLGRELKGPCSPIPL